MDKQTVYKESVGYYNIHKDILIKKGYKITEDNRKYTVFVKEDDKPILKFVGE